MYTLFNQSRYISKPVRNLMAIVIARNLLENSDPNGNITQKYNNIRCTCKTSEKTTAESSAIYDQPETQVQRQVNTILFVPGGRTQYGNFLTNDELVAYLEEVKNNPRAFPNGRVNFNGLFEGQPGGIRGALKNKF
jgi:hypothetical protein